MPEEIAKNIYRIGVPLPENPLRELNSYFIRGDDHDVLIDTGFRRDECRAALNAGLAELGSAKERRDVLLTHLHSDHSGLSVEYVGAGRNIYISRIDMEVLSAGISGSREEKRHTRYLTEGFPARMLDFSYTKNPAITMAPAMVDERFIGLEDGALLEVGEYKLQLVLVPGHTPGNAMIWLEKQGIMFTGDHVLFDISPNIAVFSEAEDLLGDYMDSLRASRGYPVKYALPAHRKTGNYHERVDALLLHHEHRLAGVLQIISENPGLSAYEITPRMRWNIRADSWETFPLTQKWFAMGECLTHLDYQRLRGIIRREMEDGVYKYYVGK